MPLVVIPTFSTLPAKAVLNIIGEEDVLNTKDIISFINTFDKPTNISFDEILSYEVEKLLTDEDKYLLPYILNKMWIGDKLIYEEELESKILKYL